MLEYHNALCCVELLRIFSLLLVRLLKEWSVQHLYTKANNICKNYNLIKILTFNISIFAADFNLTVIS